MANGQQKMLSGATPVPRVGDRYDLTDRTGRAMGSMALETLQNMIRQGRLFRSDLVSKNNEPPVSLGRLEEFDPVFVEVLPEPFKVDGENLRPAPQMQGDLDALSFGRVLGRLFCERRTGRLFVTSESSQDQSKVVIFRQGIPINAMSNIAEEWIGEVLINHGLIDAASFQEAVEHRKNDPNKSQRIGSALVLLNKLSPRELKKALSLQAMQRLINLFKQGEGRFSFVPDESAAQEEVLLVAGPRDIIETGLASTFTGEESTEILASYGDPVFRAEVPEPLKTSLSGADLQILELIRTGKPVSELVGSICQLASLTDGEARTRLLALLLFGAIQGGGEADVALEAQLEKVSNTDFYQLLETRRAATPEEVTAAWAERREQLCSAPIPTDSPHAAKVRKRIDAVLLKARDTLCDTKLNEMYQRSLQLRLDFEHPEVRQRLEHEYLLTIARSLVAQQKYTEAREHFLRAATLQPDDSTSLIELGWAQFLGSERDGTAALAALKYCTRALKLAPESDKAYLTIGKIHRLCGELRPAEDNLRRAIELNQHNTEAQSELRLLFTRELSKTKDKKVSLNLRAGPTPVFVLALAVIGGLFFTANVMGGGQAEIPDLVQMAESDDAEGEELAVEMARAQRERMFSNETEFKPAERTLGNIEYFWLSDDLFWWGRRIGLFVLAMLGIFLVGLKRSDLAIAGKNPGWIMAALPYGLVLGLFSSAPLSSTSTGLLLAMCFVHVLAEQAFFIWFIGRGLSKHLKHPLAAVGLVVVFYALYQLSFYAIWHEPVSLKVQEIPRIGAFVGGAAGLFMWRSGGLLAPFVMHLVFMAVTFLMA